MSDMTVHIHRIVLDGLSVSYHQQPMLKAALESELAQLFADGIWSSDLQSDINLYAIPGSEIRDVDEAIPVQLGRQIAQAIYRGLNR